MRHTFCKRSFLNPASTLATSYVHAWVQDSKNGEVGYGGNMLIIADCHRVTEFEFCLGSKQYRRDSLKKINVLIDTLTGFRDALKTEADQIAAYRKPRKAKKKS